MAGRKPIGDQPMTPAERQRRKRKVEEFRLQRAEQARESLSEGVALLTKLWDSLNGKSKYAAIQDEIGRARRLCGRANTLLNPVCHLPMSRDESRRLICGSTDFEHVANPDILYVHSEEALCPECMARKYEFYP